MRILGIDPGVAIVGFGVLDCAGAAQKMVQYGAINTPAGMPLAARLTLIESHRGVVFQQEHHHRYRGGSCQRCDSLYGGETASAHL